MGTCAFMVAAIIAMIRLKPQGYLPVKARPVFSGQVVNELCQVDIHFKGINQSSENVDFDPDDHPFICFDFELSPKRHLPKVLRFRRAALLGQASVVSCFPINRR